MANTPTRPFRIPDDVYKAAQARAEAEGIPLTAVVVYALKRYAAGASNNVMPPPAQRG